MNRSTTEVLKKLLTRAGRLGRAFRPRAEVEIKRTRCLSRKSAFASWSATERFGWRPRPEELVGPFFAFARASGLRLRECLLRWPEDRVGCPPDQEGRQRRQEARHRSDHTDSPSVCGRYAGGRADKFSPTSPRRQPREGYVKGRRYPLTYSGVKVAWRRLRKRAGVEGFRFHDFRHEHSAPTSCRDWQLEACPKGAEPLRPQKPPASIRTSWMTRWRPRWNEHQGSRKTETNRKAS